MSGLSLSLRHPALTPRTELRNARKKSVAKTPTPSPTPITYADAGVDISRANRTKQRIKYLAHKTFTRGVLSEIGGFGGLFAIDKTKYTDPVLVSSVDGVGTKLKIAFEMDLHSTVGADLVNHCVNDIAVQGAAPLFFMDYLATGTLDPSIAEKVVEGIADACKHNGCALIGGETAEMPGFIRMENMIWRASLWAWWSAKKSSPGKMCRSATSFWACRRMGCIRTDIRWRGNCCSKWRIIRPTPT
jgi:hypothetical protein